MGSQEPCTGVAPTGSWSTMVRVPHLIAPTTEFRESFLSGEAQSYADEHLPTDALDDAAADFDAWVLERTVVRTLWEVPTTELWLVEGPDYLGAIVIRHRLTPQLLEAGGHLGYHVVPAHRRRGHATAMVAQALVICRSLDLARVLVTCAPDNIGSRRVIEANAGVYEDQRAGECRYWIDL
jgi:predicted acetyltransferase